jgi:hypothetical protein
LKTVCEGYDLVVCGGGLAGLSAAVAAARQGLRTCLVQDRPVLGGNSSSEIRVTPHGAANFHTYARETGIISELLIEERALNHETIFENGWTNSVWDLVLYNLARSTPNLTLHVNTTVIAVETSGSGRIDTAPGPEVSAGLLHRAACASGKLTAVFARVANAETELVLRAPYFIDCTGDALIAHLAGCEWRMGSEGRDEFGEPHAPAAPTRETMGNSLHFRARDIGRPAPFIAPDWAVKYDDAGFFYQQGRVPHDLRGGYWWIEIGVPWNTIEDSENIRHELTRHTLGVWDWIKNRDPRTRDLAANFALDWIGQVPGKRESRRVMGLHFLNEHDVAAATAFPDEIAFGGWFIDLHTPGGLLASSAEPASAEGYSPASDYARKSYVGPYGLPLCSLVSKDVPNLLMAGRNLSATHAALGSVRVMATTALLGQAAGTAVVRAVRTARPPAAFGRDDLSEIQQQLLRDGCFLPSVVRNDPHDLAPFARATATSSAWSSGAECEPSTPQHNLTFWSDHLAGEHTDTLARIRGQWIAIGTERLHSIEVCLSNLTDETHPVSARLVPVDHLWDYRVEPAAPLATTTLLVPPGRRRWIKWPLGNLAVTPGRYLRLDLGPAPQIGWTLAGTILPGHPHAFDMGGGRMRRHGCGITACFRVHPPQPVYEPANVLAGAARPHRWTNLWRSVPAQPLPQSLELSWSSPQTVRQIELTFPGNLFTEYHAYAPFSRDPQCPRDYRIEALTEGGWNTVVATEGNYQRHRRHALATAITSNRIRIVVTATNGDPSAQIYEVRCYA